jgi:hypothetical protein
MGLFDGLHPYDPHLQLEAEEFTESVAQKRLTHLRISRAIERLRRRLQGQGRG